MWNMVPRMDDKTETQSETQAKAGAMIVPVTLFEQNCTIIWHDHCAGLGLGLGLSLGFVIHAWHHIPH